MDLAEDIIRDKATGVLLAGNYLTYKAPTFLDAPPTIVCNIIEKHDPACPYGAKGVGEPCSNIACASITNAIYNAIGVRMDGDLWPPTPDIILKALGKV
jgi:CO/xanthine dehydrogenase Mo-binding subunit